MYLISSFIRLRHCFFFLFPPQFRIGSLLSFRHTTWTHKPGTLQLKHVHSDAAYLFYTLLDTILQDTIVPLISRESHLSLMTRDSLSVPGMFGGTHVAVTAVTQRTPPNVNHTYPWQRSIVSHCWGLTDIVSWLHTRTWDQCAQPAHMESACTNMSHSGALFAPSFMLWEGLSRPGKWLPVGGCNRPVYEK